MIFKIYATEMLISPVHQIIAVGIFFVAPTAPSSNNLFGSLVDLGKESLKDFLLQTRRLVNCGNLGAQLTNNLLLILLVQLLQLKFLKHLLHLGFLLRVLAAVVLIQHLTLLGGAERNCLVDQPRALVVLNIGADLSNESGVTEVVKVVILDLEVLAQRDQDIVSLLQVLWSGALEIHHSQGDGKIEAVISRLVGDNKHVLLHREIIQVDVVLRGGDQIAQLTQLGLPGSLVEELDDVDIRRVGAEALLQNHVDGRFKHEGIVDGDQTDTLLTVPARQTTAGNRAIHQVVADQEESLQQLSEPAQNAQVLELFVVQGLLEEGETGIGH